AITSIIKLNPVLHFASSERLPVEVVDVLGRHESAWLLVTDHRLASTTDNNGIARFSELPVGVELAMRLSAPWLAPWIGTAVQFKSTKLKFKGGRFKFVVTNTGVTRHDIKVIRAGL